MARADDTNGVVSLEPPMRVRDLPSKQVSKLRTWSFATSTAAVVLVLAASALWWLHDGDLLGLPKTYKTAHGEQTLAQLPDGSELHLNTDSAVTVRYTRSERVVEIADASPACPDRDAMLLLPGCGVPGGLRCWSRSSLACVARRRWPKIRRGPVEPVEAAFPV